MLLSPIKVGQLQLQHRVVMAPLTRMRNTVEHSPTETVAEYYRQRSASPGSLLISEATGISKEAGIPPRMPGIWSHEQATNWKQVTKAVHANGSFIFSQLWAAGRKNRMPGTEVTSASAIEMDDGMGLGVATPRPLTHEEIQQYLQWYATAAKNAVEISQFDGVEIHAANGYLPEQFLREITNQRSDEYGGSIENRTLLTRQIIETVSKALNNQNHKIGIRISPWTRTGDVRATGSTKAEYTYLLNWIQKNYPNLAYVSIFEPRLDDFDSKDSPYKSLTKQDLNRLNDFVYAEWKGPLIRASEMITPDHSAQPAFDIAEKNANTLIAFGRYYISNPDLPHRLKNSLPLTHYDRATFYGGETKGYTDYPTATDCPTATN